MRRVNGRSGELRVGCSGWSYRDWRGVVYPTRRSRVALVRGLRRAVRHRRAEQHVLSAAAGADRRALARTGAGRVPLCGQGRSVRDASQEAGRPDWLARSAPRSRPTAGPSAGPQLVQLPPRWRRDVPRLDEFLDAAPDDLRWAVEVRDRSWLHDDVFDLLARHGAALCVHDLLRDHPWELTADWAYVRFHGPDPDRRYHGRYGGRRLWRPAERIGEWCDAGRDVFAYFNNDFHGHAVVDARWLRDRVVCAARATSAGSAPD